ncbi:MAG: glycosyltransferase family 4 protein [Bacteroidota bacterium]
MERPFRILMVLDQDFPPDARVENEARTLQQAGFEVTVLAIAPDDRPATDMLEGVRIIRARISAWQRNKMRGLSGTFPFLEWYLVREIGKIYADWPFDALHMHDLYLFGGGLKAGRSLDVPVVGDLHENWVEALKHYAWSTRAPGKWVVSIPRWQRLEHAWVNAVDGLVVVIEEAAVRNEALGVPTERIHVVPNTIQLADFDGFVEEPDLIHRLQQRPTILYTGGMDIHRGLASVIDAMPDVIAKHPEAQLVLVGNGRVKPELEAQAQRLGVLNTHVLFEGWQPQARLKSYMLGSQVCLVPHLKTVHTDNTIPHKLFHYMYFARPVVVSNCDPLKRIVDETQAGRVYPAGESAPLASALIELLGAADERDAMGQRGREAVVDRYHWAKTVTPLIDLYTNLGLRSVASC